ncbi:MAG: 23S rRNA (adenine(2030)-N(6))-methyltransferase RlmJ [Gammaproteobacteria bacterium HGW-Gammaproteobacteria-3]|nr:MAG: 23S rRNA (adenine(2030)-N(6))-methyltransferase RlmJ [Gammaproteobacteria bacterium HGW-Gammaproteobacteria-3]
MLSYRHGFHAGNFADVLKHALLSLAIAALKKKDSPFVYIDTHAGAGRYALTSAFAEKTGEYRQGIGRLWPSQTVPSEAREYLSVVRRDNPGKLIYYPGSPALVRAQIRPQDRMQLSELHGSDFAVLNNLYKNDKQVAVAEEDGLKNLPKKLPPIQKRGLILIDPSYEIKTDYVQVVTTLAQAYRRFTTGVYCLWYPVIERETTEDLMRRLVATGIPRQLRIEHCLAPDAPDLGMTGSGLVFINPPWQLDVKAKALLPWLDQCLGDDRGRWRVDWQAPE